MFTKGGTETKSEEGARSVRGEQLRGQSHREGRPAARTALGLRAFHRKVQREPQEKAGAATLEPPRL